MSARDRRVERIIPNPPCSTQNTFYSPANPNRRVRDNAPYLGGVRKTS
jgi:hypothetical protein